MSEMESKPQKFILRGGYSNINGWHSKMLLINKVNKHNKVSIKFYSDTDGKQLIMNYHITLEPLEIRAIELDFNQLKDHYGRIDLESDHMLDGNVITMKDDSIIDLRLVRLDAGCC
jgi:hypothetical protein